MGLRLLGADDQIAAAGIASFCLIILPPRMRGATGAPVRPIAMV